MDAWAGRAGEWRREDHKREMSTAAGAHATTHASGRRGGHQMEWDENEKNQGKEEKCSDNDAKERSAA